MDQPTATGYAPVDGIDLYWESYGGGGTPVIVVHGGFGLIGMCRPLIDQLAGVRRVLAVELQGHGHTRDVARPFTYEAFGDDVAGLAEHLNLAQVDLVGYSLGAGCCLRAAIQHPGLVRRLAVVSTPCRRDGWFPEVRASFDVMGAAGFDQLKHSPMYAAWREVAPDLASFPTLMNKTGALLRRPYDWSEDVRAMATQTLLAFADADSIPVTHAAEFYALLGGGLMDAGVDGAARPASRLAVVPGQTHYDIFASAALMTVIDDFLS
jgi:pimeloyl-ACP methyl ester carboxylesterase